MTEAMRLPAASGVSYVVTVFNKAAHLPAVIEGLRRQEGEFEREFIFVDDGSTDDSVAVIEREAADLSGVVVVKQRNSGPSWALNAGLARARMPYIKGLDGDDVPLPKATLLLLEAMQTTGCPVAYGTYRGFRLGSEPFADLQETRETVPPPVRIERPLERLANGGLFGNPSCWLATRNLLLATGGSDPTVFIQDVSITLRMAARGPFAILDHPVFLAPYEDDSRLSGNKVQILHDINRAYANFFAQNPGVPAILRWRAAIRLTARAWKWARRERGAGLASPEFWRHVRSMAALDDPISLMEASCDSFSGEIRVPPRDRTPPELPAP